MYTKYAYQPHEIWNLDEFGAQANKHGLGKVMARKGAKKIHVVIPNEKEWMTALTTINVAGKSLSNFYIFKRQRYTRDYIAKCTNGALWAMQKRVDGCSHFCSTDGKIHRTLGRKIDSQSYNEASCGVRWSRKPCDSISDNQGKRTWN